MVRIKKALVGICTFAIVFKTAGFIQLKAAPNKPPRPVLLDQIQVLIQASHQKFPWLAYDTKYLMEALDRIIEECSVEEDSVSEAPSIPSAISKVQTQDETFQNAENLDLSSLSNEAKSWSWGYPDDSVSKYKGYYNKGGDQLFLTMDFGSDFGYTDPILDTLKEKGVKATLFLTTEYVQNHPQHVKRMAQDGHVLGNHSTGHINMVKLLNQSQAELIANTRAWEVAMDNLLGYHTHLYRAPEGVYSEAGLAQLSQMGYETIFWGAAYKDYDPDDQPHAQSALKEIISRTKPGDIVLLHPMKANAEILGDYIDYWQSQGMTFNVLSSN